MYLVTGITSDPAQTIVFDIPNLGTAYMTIRFNPQARAWFIEKLTWKDFVINGMKLVNNYNMLYQYKNKLGWGLACFGARDPQIDLDFSSGASQLFVLDSSDLVLLETQLQNG